MKSSSSIWSIYCDNATAKPSSRQSPNLPKETKEIAIAHLIHAIPAKTHPPMYYMHKYWARKPHNVVAEYISTYSKKGEIVLDPFGGSGVTAIEAVKRGRRGIPI